MKMKKTVRMPLRRAPQPRTRPPAASLRARTATAEEYDEEEEDYGGEEEPNMKFSHALLVVLVLHILAVGGIFAFNSLKAKQSAEIKQAAAPAATEKAAPAPEAQASTPAEKAAARPLTQPAAVTGKTHTVAAGETLTKIASIHGITIEALEKENGITTYSMIRVGQVLKLPEDAKPAGKAAAKSEPAKSAATKDAFMATKTEAPAKPAQGAIVSTPKAAAETKPAAPVEKAPAEAVADDGVYVVVKGDNPYSIAKKLHVSYNDLLSVNDIKDPTKIQIGQKLKVPNKN